MSKADVQQHNRRSIRLKGYDYSLPGAYFITIVTFDRGLLLGEIVNEEMHLNALGRIVKECWQEIPGHFHIIEVDPFVIMPNHIHLITILDDNCRGTIYRAPTGTSERFGHPTIGSLPTMVRTYKSAVTRRISHELGTTKLWQRNYYDHIIRDEGEFRKIWNYIDTNPQKWEQDRLHP